MKKLWTILSVVFISVFSFAENEISASISHCVFQSPDQGPYLETYLAIAPSSVNWQSENGKYQASVSVTMLLKNEAGEIIKADKFNLMSPEVNDPKNVDFSMVDLKRFQLENGKYTLDIQLKDATNESLSSEITYNIDVKAVQDKVQISDIMLVEKFEKAEAPTMYTKSGYNLTPYAVNYYPSGFNLLTFYAEVYNTNKILTSPDYFIRYYVAKQGKSEALNNMVGFAKQKASDVNVAFSSLDIAELASGNYDLVLEVRSDQNEIISEKRMFFQRNNGVVDYNNLALADDFADKIPRDELVYRIKSLAPIAEGNELVTINSLSVYENEKEIRNYISSFFSKKFPGNPAMNFAQYSKAVDNIEEVFSTDIDYAFETDRGRVYLQYGAPDFITEEIYDRATIPHYIWHYYQLEDNQTDIKFVFANHNRSTNDFKLIHSNARGELSNRFWRRELNRTKTIDDIDEDGSLRNIFDDGNDSDPFE